jgi:D-alanyl-D-alanine carboxypeptidase/D-alanyl-D-alanine-endopeptidase (penicillin-binding protein 4)
MESSIGTGPTARSKPVDFRHSGGERRVQLRTAICWAFALLLIAAGAKAEGPLSGALDAALDVRALRNAQVGALVVARGDGRLLYARSPDRALIPASNQKILTAVAALRAFGPAHAFPIGVYSDAPPDAEGSVANLYLQATGDPSLTSEDYWRFAADLRMAGLRSVRGDLVIDDTAFDAERWNPIWGPISSRAYHAPVGAFTANYGAFTVVVVPGANSGDRVTVRVDPPVPYLRVVNKALTSSRRKQSRLTVKRSLEADHEQIEVGGNLRVGSEPAVFRRSVEDPVGYAAAVLRMQLEANGITVAGEDRLGVAPESAPELLLFAAHPVSEIVRLFMKYSNNGMAESLVKALGARASGAPGSWANGIPALSQELAAIGVPMDGMRIVDGSGLSYDNRVSPRQLVAALRIADASFAMAPEFAASLPVSGADGTLEKRVEDAVGAARAKTGLLTSVTALSGHAMLSDGTEVVFSVMVNDFRSIAERAMDALDHFVVVLSQAAATGADGTGAAAAAKAGSH